MEQPAPERRSVIQEIADLLQMIVDWLRQEAEAAVREKVVAPLQKLGLTLIAAWAAASLVVMGMVFISIALLLLLAQWLTWPGALGLIGGVLVLGSAIFAFIKVRSMQR